jgi:hypothetical protein
MNRFVFCAVALGLTVLAACGSANKPGVTSPMPPSTTSCLVDGSRCATDRDCCTLWCFAGECVRYEP